LQNAGTGVSQYRTTNTLGYFSFSNVQVGEFYTLTVTSRRYSFQPQAFTLLSDVEDLIFIPSS
ncbi:MAG TPA: hypothetical protein PLK77_18700, partial [Pyrinomonadaceae bacterium]|nr:hypothetical protein [Pyrinomonadaceae bacterium]